MTWSQLSGRRSCSVVSSRSRCKAGALLDLRRRADAELNGSKRVWALVSFVNFLGPIAYFLAGRRRTISAGVGSSR